MKLTLEQLTQSLRNAPLKRCYWLAGDEPWARQEAQEALWQRAQSEGFVERIRLDPDAQFDWAYWAMDVNSQSLFSTQRYVELRLKAGKLPEAGVKSLLRYLQQPNPCVLLVISSPKIEQHAATQKVVAACDGQGVVCSLWPLTRQQLPAWLERRLHSVGLSTSNAGLQCLVDYTEGNVLAAVQAIDLLALLYPAQTLSVEQLTTSLVKQARFDVFGLGEAFLQQDPVRFNRMLVGLQAEGVEPVLVLWALAKEIRLMLCLSEVAHTPSALQAIWPTLGIWDKRRGLYQAALRLNKDWPALMVQAAACDVVLKGYADGEPWQCFSRLLA